MKHLPQVPSPPGRGCGRKGKVCFSRSVCPCGMFAGTALPKPCVHSSVYHTLRLLPGLGCGCSVFRSCGLCLGKKSSFTCCLSKENELQAFIVLHHITR